MSETAALNFRFASHWWKLFLRTPHMHTKDAPVFGCTDYDKCEISIEPNLPDGRIVDIFRHELGHVVAWASDNCSGNSELQANWYAAILFDYEGALLGFDTYLEGMGRSTPRFPTPAEGQSDGVN